MATNGVNGNLSNGMTNGHEAYSVPDETSKVFQRCILEDGRTAKDLPEGITEAAAKIHFTGSPDPSIPVNWRFAEAVASLKGLEASLVNLLLKRKYGAELQEVSINTDHATLFVMSATMWTVDPGEGGMNISLAKLRDVHPQLEKMFPQLRYPESACYTVPPSFYQHLSLRRWALLQCTWRHEPRSDPGQHRSALRHGCGVQRGRGASLPRCCRSDP